MGGPPLNEMSPAEARQAAAAFADFAGPPDPVASIANQTIPGLLGDIPVRIYTPHGEGPFPIVVYFHGGGWVIGSLDAVDVPCTMLANRSRSLVVSVDYRLAPEHKFPAAVLDCYAATEWAATHAAELNGDSTRLAVAGDSAGGNLAAVVCALAREIGSVRIAFQALFYPVTNFDFTTRSYQECGADYFLTTDMMQWFWKLYLRSESDGSDWRASPLRLPNVRELPPAFIVTAEYDPLRDEGEQYALRLREGGVPVVLKRLAGQIHGFIWMPGVMDAGKEAVDDAAALLRVALAHSS